MAVFTFLDLDTVTRGHMLQELVEDQIEGVLYLSDRLSFSGKRAYPDLLTCAAREHDAVWLQQALERQGMFLELVEEGGKVKKCPSNASQLLAQGEFNRFYCRAILIRGKSEQRKVSIYRARASSNPRPESELKIGRHIEDFEEVLEDLRHHLGAKLEFGMPDINSGLSLKLHPMQ